MAKEDVALVVAGDVPAAEVEAALREGAGELLESMRLFDVYTGDQVGEGSKSLAYRAALPGARPDADDRGGRGSATAPSLSPRGHRSRQRVPEVEPPLPSSPVPRAASPGSARGWPRRAWPSPASPGRGALATAMRRSPPRAGASRQRADVTDPAAVDAASARRRGVGRVDLLVNNAGLIEPEVPLWEADPDQWWRTVTVNMRGPFLMSRPSRMMRHAAAAWSTSPAASALGERGDSPPTGASKTALTLLTGGILEPCQVARRPGVRPSPGVVHTDMTARMRIRRPDRVDPAGGGDRLVPALLRRAGAWSGRRPRRHRHPASLPRSAPRASRRTPRLRLHPGGRTTRWPDPDVHRYRRLCIVMHMTSVAVAGASGYAGGELLRLLLAHPDVEIGAAHRRLQRRGAARRAPAAPAPLADRVLEETTPETLAGHDVVFLALPHGAVRGRRRRSCPTTSWSIDCGADFRLTDAERLGGVLRRRRTPAWPYGLPELPGQRRRSSPRRPRIAVPGCYPTASTLALAPGVRRRAASSRDVVVVAAAGTSGAGKAPSRTCSAAR